MNDKIPYGWAAVGSFFGAMSFQHWIALIGLLVSIVLGVANFVVNRRHKQEILRIERAKAKAVGAVVERDQ